MKKVIAGLQVGLAFVVAATIAVILLSLWIAFGWVAACVVGLVTIGAAVALWAMFRRGKEVR
jgi:hypothetical protein